MKLKELTEIVQDLIGRNKTKDVIDKIIKWTQNNDERELRNNIVLIKEKFRQFRNDSNFGLLSNSETIVEQIKINNSVLNALDHLNENNISDTAPIDGDKFTSSKKLRILVLTANPTATTKINLDKEYSTINQKLQEKQEFFNIILKKAVSGTEFQEFTQQGEPDALHFPGQGKKGKENNLKHFSPKIQQLQQLRIPIADGSYDVSKLKDINPLKGLKNLEQINLENIQVNDLTPLQNLIKLQQLRFNSTQTNDLNPLKNLIEQGIPVYWPIYEYGINVMDCGAP